MKRGQFVVVAIAGDYGKPRPALVVQNVAYENLHSVVVCPITTLVRDDIEECRIRVVPSRDNGLREVSQISIDKISALPIAKIGKIIGEADEELMLRVNRALAMFLGIV